MLVNGGLNLSELDGWWAEAYERANGWALGDGREHPEPEWDAVEANQLYHVLESEVIPLFYERDAAGIPRRWLQRVRTSMAALTPRFSSNRMLREYVETEYLPAASDFGSRAAEGGRVARELAAWEARVSAHWGDIRCIAVERCTDEGRVRVAAELFLGELPPNDIRVELYADPVDGRPLVCEPMDLNGAIADQAGAFRYSIAMRTDRPPAHFTPRVVPFHPDAHVPLELSLIRWLSCVEP